MKAYLIDPFAREIRQVEYGGNYQSIYGFIEASPFNLVRFNREGDGVYVDDEGLFKPNRFFQISTYVANGMPYPLAGKGLVLGHNMAGDSQEPTVSIHGLRALVNFPDRDVVELAYRRGLYNTYMTSVTAQGTAQRTLIDTVEPQWLEEPAHA